jgi:hypothetical protein
MTLALPSDGLRDDAKRTAHALHDYLLRTHLRGGVLVGPDSGVRFNYRVGRFLKSYTPWLPWHDEHCYMQTQAYWCLASWRLGEADTACACAQGMIERQRPDGAWEYPNPEWRGRVATAEGTWAAMALVETYRRTHERSYLEAAVRWLGFMEAQIGWRAAPGGLAVEYFARDKSDHAVPNNSAFVLRFLAELSETARDRSFLERCPRMVGFIETVQRPTGELPYHVNADGTKAPLEHFQCGQYNAFQLLDLARYQTLTSDPRAAAVVLRLGEFLRGLVATDGTIPYACGRPHPRVTYHLAAVAAALA